jgi:hypothetical protein
VHYKKHNGNCHSIQYCTHYQLFTLIKLMSGKANLSQQGIYIIVAGCNIFVPVVHIMLQLVDNIYDAVPIKDINSI